MGQKDNHLSCLEWQTNGDYSPCMSDFEQSLLAAESGQISATWMPNNGSYPFLLLIYPDPSQKLNILRLLLDHRTEKTTPIVNETTKFNSALNEVIQEHEPGSTDTYLASTCTAITYRNADELSKSFYLNCVVNQHNGEVPSEIDGHKSEILTQSSNVIEFTVYADINGIFRIDDSMPTPFRCHVSSTIYRVQTPPFIMTIDRSVQNLTQCLHQPKWRRCIRLEYDLDLLTEYGFNRGIRKALLSTGDHHQTPSSLSSVFPLHLH